MVIVMLKGKVEETEKEKTPVVVFCVCLFFFLSFRQQENGKRQRISFSSGWRSGFQREEGAFPSHRLQRSLKAF